VGKDGFRQIQGGKKKDVRPGNPEGTTGPRLKGENKYDDWLKGRSSAAGESEKGWEKKEIRN